MRELHYGTGVVTVSVDVCSAVFDYTVALANAGRTDRVTVPVLADGRRDYSNLLLGPSTQLFCSAVPGQAGHAADKVDIEDAELVQKLRATTAQLVSGNPILTSELYLHLPESDHDLS